MPAIKKTRSEIKREAILQGAMQAFQQFGIKDSSMDKIAEIAKVSKRTVYNHFESKETLVAEILTLQWQKSNEAINIDYCQSEPLNNQLLSLALQGIEFVCQNQVLELIRVALGHFMHHPETLSLHTKKFFAQDTNLKRWLKMAKQDGRLKIDDVEFAAEQFASLIKGYALWPQLLQYGEPLTEQQKGHLAEQTVAMFLSHYQV